MKGSNRVIRGGSWNNNAQNVRSANRNRNAADNRNNNVGLRVVSTYNLPEMLVYGHVSRAPGKYVQAVTPR